MNALSIHSRLMDEYMGVLKKYAVFSGRASRREYWMFVLFNILVMIGIGIVGGVLFRSDTGNNPLSTIYSLAVLLPSLAVGIRRLHDVGKSGWWMLISLIPLIGFVVLLILMVMDSEPGENKYGPNPKGAMAPQPLQPTQPPTQPNM